MTDTAWPYKYFTPKEMLCKCTHCTGLPRASFMVKLEALREELGYPMRVSSGYRCPAYNVALGGTVNGPHTIGAADILCVSPKAYSIVELGMKHGMTGIGVHQKGVMNSRYIHLDDVHFPEEIWSY